MITILIERSMKSAPWTAIPWKTRWIRRPERGRGPLRRVSILEISQLQLLSQPGARCRAQLGEQSAPGCRDMRGGIVIAPKHVCLEHLAPVAALMLRQLAQCEQRGQEAIVGILEAARLVAPPVVDQHVVRLQRGDVVPPVARNEQRVTRLQEGHARGADRPPKAREALEVRRIRVDQ